MPDSTLSAADTALAHGARPVTPAPVDFEAMHDRPRLVYLRNELQRLSALAATAEHDANDSSVSSTLGDLANSLADEASNLTAAIERGDSGDKGEGFWPESDRD